MSIERPRIALIGIGCRFPGGAHGPEATWRVLSSGFDPVREVPPDRWDADAWYDPDPESPGRTITNQGAFLDDVAHFDHGRFGISPREALQMDPQQRLLLEVAWEALEDAGHAPDRLAGSRTGVFLGMGVSDYARRSFLGPDPTRIDAYSGTGTFSSVAAGRIAYTLGLRGPALAIHTACSSSLVAMHLAVEALRNGSVDLALAGGVNLLLAPEPSVYFSKLGALSADGRCRTFDASASGYGRGEGCGVVVLCRMDDAKDRGDRVRSVVLGSAINQDGHSNGLTAPSASAQRAVIEAALADASLEPGRVSLIEAHGTGTPLGDPIEASALSEVYGAGRTPCLLRSVKTAFGHTEAAAGIAGVIAASLALEHGQAPPHLHFQELNPRIDLEGTRLRIPTALTPLRGTARAGISAFGLAGTNAHLILEAASDEDDLPTLLPGRSELLVISAGSERALEALRPQYAATLRAARLEDVAGSAGTGRALLSHRLAVVASDAGDAAAQLAASGGIRGHATRTPSVVFAYTGQGSQWHEMARELYAGEASFRTAFDEVDQMLRAHRQHSLVEVIYGEEPELVGDTRWTQPALFAIGWALTKLWESWGIVPDAVIGHSIGETTAATVGGLFGLEDAVALVAERGRLMGDLPEGGGMASVRAGLAVVRETIEGLADLGVAGVNAPNETVISGSLSSIDTAVERLADAGIESTRLHVSHAFHSPLVEPILDAFQRATASVRFGELKLPLYSNLTGRLAGDEIRTATYWREHIRRPVRFAHALKAAEKDGHQLFVEIGPHPVLSGMGLRTLPESTWLPSLRRRAPGRNTMLEALGGLVVNGVRPDPTRVWPEDFLRVDLPLTPSDGERFWLQPLQAPSQAVAAYSIRWVEAASTEPVSGRWFVDGSPDAVATIASGIAELGGEVQRGLPRKIGAGENLVFCVPPSDGAESAWSHGPERMRSLWKKARSAGARLWVVTRAAVTAINGDRPDPNMAMAWGLARVLSLEDPEAWGGIVDLPSGSVRPLRAGRAFGVGEDQVAVRSTPQVPRLTLREPGRAEAPRREGSWLITGGFGGLGSSVARWLAEQGVRKVVLASRGGNKGPDREELVAELKRLGTKVQTARVDVTDRHAVVTLVDKLTDLVGVVHCAGEVAPGLVHEQSPAAFAENLRAKVLGAEALDLATRSVNLDAFVLFSSIAATWGSSGLGGYAAANAWLDALAERRRDQGLPGVSLAWGPWAHEGMVGAEDRRTFARMGVGALPVASALDALARHLKIRGHRVLADVDWDTFAPVYRARRARPFLDRVAPIPEEVPAPVTTGLSALPSSQREDGLRRAVGDQVRTVLGIDRGVPMDPDAGFFDLGMDSLMAVELQRRLRDELGIDLPPTVAFDHPTLTALCKVAAEALGWELDASEERAGTPSGPGGPIAIVGWSARFPGAPDADALERLLFDAECAVGPALSRTGGAAAGTITGIELFDADYFGMGTSEAAALDPQQRLALEGTIEALEFAGIATDRLAGRPVGVFLGIAHSAYWDRTRDPESDAWPWSGVGNEQSFAAGRIAYALGVRGPAMAVNTACSSSLVAVHLAVRALRSGECELAVVGGVNALLSPSDSAWLEQIGALSPSGRCRTFDEGADGYVRSEGCGVLVLQPLAAAMDSGRPILGVIRGTAVGHGGASGGLTVPNGPAQAEVIRHALADAGVEPDEVGYLECHGTGTPLGDPIEVGALRSVFGKRERPLALGAAKANLGHLETAAGIAGVLSAALVLLRGEAPASPLLETPNPRLDLNWPVSLPDRERPIRGLAGVSSFGISGTNAHVILGPPPDPELTTVQARGSWLIPLSAHRPEALEQQLDRLTQAIPPTGAAILPSVGRTLATGRPSLRYRRTLVVRSAAELRDRSGPGTAEGQVVPGEPVRVGWLFSGQGAQRVGMGLDLASQQPRFAAHLDKVVRAFDRHLDRPLMEVMGGPEVHDTRYTQPALFAVEWALAQTLMELGATPAAMIGHSLGEWVAAALAGVLTLDEATRVVATRGRAMSEQPRTGSMIAMRASEKTAVRLVYRHAGAELAAVNSPNDCVVSGTDRALEGLKQELVQHDIEYVELDVSHPFHSEGIEGALPALAESLSSVSLTAPVVPIYSNVDGDEIGLRATNPDYWLRQARRAVRFWDGLQNLAASVDVLLEIGPRPVLLGLAGRGLPESLPLVPTLKGPEAELTAFLDCIGSLWVRGAVDKLDPLYTDTPLSSLPSVAWQRRRLWIEPGEVRAGSTRSAPMYAFADAGEVPSEPGSTAIDLSGAATVSDVLRSVEGAEGVHLDLIAPGASSDQGSAEIAAAHGVAAVLRAERPDRTVRVIDPGAPAQHWKPWHGDGADPTGRWLVTGARGQLGRRVVRWLTAHGAEVVAVSRTRDDELASLPGVTWLTADIGTHEGVARALEGGVTGAIHCAGVNRSGFLGSVSDEDLAAVSHGKLTGAHALAELLPDEARLILFSSATAWLGLPGQAAYAAVNAALDGIALRRPNTVSIAWGPWQAGMAAESGVDWESLGVRPLSDAEALGALRQVIATSPARVAAIAIDPAAFQRERGALDLLRGLAPAPGRRASLPELDALEPLSPAARVSRLDTRIGEVAAQVLGHPLDGGLGFFEAGMDSLGAVELTRRLGRMLGLALPATLAFDHPTPTALAEALLDRLDLHVPAGAPSPAPAAPLEVGAPSVPERDDPIAVVGLACRFPGADDAEALWELMRSGGHAIREVGPDRWDADAWYDADPSAPGKMYTRQGGFLDDIDRFDPDLFGISPREATSLDPQQRLLLETTWRALDDASALDRAEGSRTGVFVGVAERGWLRRFEGDHPFYLDAWSGTGSEASFAAGRVAHALGLRGPAVALNTTCSSSLVALHLAAEAIRRGDCDTALAGGVHLVLDPESTVYLCRLGALSPTGRCHTFDEAADGYVRGEGCGILVLKRLSEAVRDGDRVRAVLRGSAINHDGHASGLTVPSGPAQTEVIRAALEDARLAPDAIGWLQAHGTGTPLGDPIELSAASRAYEGRIAKLPVGTVKTAIGHCELAAGAAGAIAAILALEHEAIPPHPVDRVNPELRLDGWTLPESELPWPRSTRPRRVGVSAFGLSGTNAHVIFEEGPSLTPAHALTGPQLIPLAAHTSAAFQSVAEHASDVATEVLARGLPVRASLPVRAAVVATAGTASAAIAQASPRRSSGAPRVALLFTGQGSQWAGMHRALLDLPVFSEAFDRALGALAAAEPTLAKLREILDDEAELGKTQHTQPALWAFEVAAAAQWRAWGLEPVAVAGHSIGEISAATVAGGLSLQDGARLVAARGRLMGSLPEGGSMFVAHASEEAIAGHLATGVEVTGVNDPEETALAGPADAVDATIETLEGAGIAVTRLNVSHAFHTARMDPILDDYQAVAAEAEWLTPRLTVVSTLTGSVLVQADAQYWRRHAREAVRFADAVRTLDGLGCDAFVECGPHPILVRMGQRTLGAGNGLWLGSVRRGDADAAEALRSLGRYWERGGRVRWDALVDRRNELFPYPMQRRRLWPEGDRFVASSWTFEPRWVRADPARVHGASWTVIGSGSLVDGLRRELDAGESLEALTQGGAVIDVASAREGGLTERIDRAREVAKTVLGRGGRIWWITRGGLRAGNPDVAGFHAWARAVFAEHPQLRGGVIDLEATASSGRAQAENLLDALGHAEAVVEGPTRFTPRIERQVVAGTAATSGTWLLTGGLGTLGRQVASWLADQGATKLLLTARSPVEPGPRADAIESLRARGVQVRVGTFDAGDADALREFLRDESLTGVIHLAGTTDPQPVLDAEPGREAAVVANAIEGARALDAWTRENPVDHFVLFGSIAAAWGSKELGGYGAANAWLGGLAVARRSEGLPATCIHWGPWGGGGMVDEGRAELLERMGQRLLDPEAALRVLGAAMASERAEIIAARVDWDRFLLLTEASGPLARFDTLRPTSVARPAAAPEEPTQVLPDRPPVRNGAWLRAEIARLAHQTLRLEPGTELDPEQPLMERGFDSLMATELNNALLERGIDVPLGRLLGGPSIEEMAIMAEARSKPVSEAEAPTPTAVPETSAPQPLFWTHAAALIVGAAIASALWFAFG